MNPGINENIPNAEYRNINKFQQSDSGSSFNKQNSNQNQFQQTQEQTESINTQQQQQHQYSRAERGGFQKVQQEGLETKETQGPIITPKVAFVNDENIKEIKNKIESEVKNLQPGQNLSASTVKEVMDVITNLSTEDFTSLYDQFDEELDIVREERQNRGYVQKIQEFFGVKEKWQNENVQKLLKSLGIEQEVWDRSFNTYLTDDKEFGAFYQSWQQKMLDKAVPWEDITDKQRQDIKEFFHHKWEDYSKDPKWLSQDDLPKFINEKVVRDIKDNFGVSFRTIYDTIEDVAQQLTGKR